MISQAGKKVMLLSAMSPEELQPVQEVLGQWLGDASEAGCENPPVDLSGGFLKAFMPAFYIGTGSLCAAVGYLFAPNLTFGYGSQWFLLWPMGLWVAALGLLEWMGFPATRKVLGLDIQSKDGEVELARVGSVPVLGVLWILSYLFFCRVGL